MLWGKMDIKGAENSEKQQSLKMAVNVKNIDSTQMDFADLDNSGFTVKLVIENKAQLYLKNKVVATGFPSKARVFIFNSNGFSGIGYNEGADFILEYIENETLQQIVLEVAK